MVQRCEYLAFHTTMYSGLFIILIFNEPLSQHIKFEDGEELIESIPDRPMNKNTVLSNLENFTMGMNDEAWGLGASKTIMAKGGQSRLLLKYIVMMKSKPVNDEDFKKQIRTLINVPKFLGNVLGFVNSETIFHLLNEYLRMHVCQNEGCDNLTELKCSICKISKYCSRSCQTKDFENHKPDCSRMEQLCRKGRRHGKGVQQYLEKDLGVQIVSFRVFYDEIMMRAYEAFLYFLQKHKSNISYKQMKNFARLFDLTSIKIIFFKTYA